MTPECALARCVGRATPVQLASVSLEWTFLVVPLCATRRFGLWTVSRLLLAKLRSFLRSQGRQPQSRATEEEERYKPSVQPTATVSWSPQATDKMVEFGRRNRKSGSIFTVTANRLCCQQALMS
jgi:hypothetical protein